MRKLRTPLKMLHNKGIWSRILFIFMIILFAIIPFSLRVQAASDNKDYYSHLSDEEMSEIFEFTTDDIPNPWAWVMDTQTYVIAEKYDDGQVMYWWNVPNIQMTFQNMLYDVISSSGYGSGMGKLASENEWLVDIPENAKTALEQYGFNIPSPAYMGERPLITIDVLGVIIPDGVLDGLGRLGSLIFDGRCIDAPTDKDMDTLVYVAPRDYDSSAITFQRWVEDNWYDAIGDGDKLGKTQNMNGETVHAQILVSQADENGMLDGKQWIAENIIWQEGLDEPGLNAEYICSELQQICGKYYSEVCKNIILVSGIGNEHQMERIMPYDLTRMNDKDAKMFNGIVDPRSESQENLFSTGYLNMIWNMIKSAALTWSGKLAEISVALNSVANFSFLERIGFDPVSLWTNEIVQLLVFLAMCVFLFFVVKSAFQVLMGNYSTIRLITKVFGAFVIVMMVWALGSDPDNTYSNIKTISSKVFTLGNVIFEQNEKIQSLYGTGDADDKESVNLWLPYFNMWTLYQTNYGVLDDVQTIDLDSSQPEVLNLEETNSIPDVDGVKQTLWSTLLADDFTQKKNYSGRIYRVVDHFMAPRISDVELKDGDIKNLKVSENENYEGSHIQSNINVMNLPLQLLILFLVLMKVVLFFEFIFNITMLIFNLCLSTSDNYKILLTLKELGASMLNVMFINIILGLVIYTSLLTDGVVSLLVCVFYIFLAVNLIKSLANSNSVFTPKFFRPLEKIYYGTKRMFEFRG